MFNAIQTKLTMNKTGPIIIIEDDVEDKEILYDVFKELEIENEIIFFSECHLVLEYLTSIETEPFLILSDIEMPELNGLELRAQIHTNENFRLKGIPYLFFSTWAEQKYVLEAYFNSVHGFFLKPHDWNHIKRTIKIIIEYWQACESPQYSKASLKYSDCPITAETLF
jgi:two-component SAPR family response regulator